MEKMNDKKIVKLSWLEYSVNLLSAFWISSVSVQNTYGITSRFLGNPELAKNIYIILASLAQVILARTQYIVCCPVPIIKCMFDFLSCTCTGHFAIYLDFFLIQPENKHQRIWFIIMLCEGLMCFTGCMGWTVYMYLQRSNFCLWIIYNVLAFQEFLPHSCFRKSIILW